MSCGVAGIVKAKKQEQKKKQSSWKNGLLSSKNNERIMDLYAYKSKINTGTALCEQARCC